MWPYPKIIAHRGAGVLAPENTLAAMRHGLAYGFRAVEFDVMLSKDRVPILMHDDSFGRTIAGEGNVADFTAEQIFQMDAGCWFSSSYSGEPPPAFDSVTQFCRENDVWMNIEIKPVPGFEEITGRVVAEAVNRNFATELAFAATDSQLISKIPLLSSFSFIALQAAQIVAADVPRGLLAVRRPADWLRQCKAIGAVSVHLNQQYIRADEVAEIKLQGFGVMCYTVNDTERASQILNMGVDAFCTDRIDLISPDFAKKHSINNR